MKYPKSHWALLGLALLVIILRLPTLIEPFDNDSEANAYHARQIVRGEPLYGSHHPAHHLPAVAYTYALGFMLFGDSVGAIKLFLIIWHIVTAFLIYGLGKRLGDGDWRVGFWAGTLFAIVTSHIWLKGTTGELELFANLPQVAAIFLVVELLRRNTKSWKFVFVGILSAATFWYKAVFVAPFAVAILVVCLHAWLTRKEQPWRQSMSRLIWIGVGFAGFSLAVVACFAALGVLPGLLLVFQLGSKYVNRADIFSSLLLLFFSPLIVLAINNCVFLLLSLAGGGRIMRQVIQKKKGVDFALAGFAVCAWYVLSFMEAGFSLSSWVHYSLIIIPALSLLAAWELVQIHTLWKTRKPAARWFYSPTVWLISLACLVSLAVNFNFQVGFYRYLVGNITRDAYFQIASLNARSELLMRPLTDYVKANTTPDDRIYIWSDYNFYYDVDRLSPIETIWPLYADAIGSHQRIFSPQTKYIILGESVQIERPAWLLEGLAQNYILETTISGLDVYRRQDR